MTSWKCKPKVLSEKTSIWSLIIFGFLIYQRNSNTWNTSFWFNQIMLLLKLEHLFHLRSMKWPTKSQWRTILLIINFWRDSKLSRRILEPTKRTLPARCLLRRRWCKTLKRTWQNSWWRMISRSEKNSDLNNPSWGREHWLISRQIQKMLIKCETYLIKLEIELE